MSLVCPTQPSARIWNAPEPTIRVWHAPPDPQLVSEMALSPQYESGMPCPTLSLYLEYSRVRWLPHGAVQLQPIPHNMSTYNITNAHADNQVVT